MHRANIRVSWMQIAAEWGEFIQLGQIDLVTHESVRHYRILYWGTDLGCCWTKEPSSHGNI